MERAYVPSSPRGAASPSGTWVPSSAISARVNLPRQPQANARWCITCRTPAACPSRQAVSGFGLRGLRGSRQAVSGGGSWRAVSIRACGAPLRLRWKNRPGAGTAKLASRPKGRCARTLAVSMKRTRYALRLQADFSSRPLNRPRQTPPAASAHIALVRRVMHDHRATTRAVRVCHRSAFSDMGDGLRSA
jgi:hypothetical protein